MQTLSVPRCWTSSSSEEEGAAKLAPLASKTPAAIRDLMVFPCKGVPGKAAVIVLARQLRGHVERTGRRPRITRFLRSGTAGA
ncbi:PPE family protein, SVP subgroup [Stutzerimonas stutzeri]|uniref:PPE family protein, SVP subgroup n=1 Tax=Stutzerimonas stutzeri TaxID=316 RepID=UPI003C6F658C